MEIVTGIALIVLAYGLYYSLKPRGRPVAAFMQREVIAASITLGLIATFTIGVAVFIHGISRVV